MLRRLTLHELHELTRACGFVLAGDWDEYGDADVLEEAQTKLNEEINRRESRHVKRRKTLYHGDV